MKDTRKIKIIDNINGVIYELYTTDEYNTYLQNIIEDLTKETYYNYELGETTIYYKPITIIERTNTEEEDTIYQIVTNIYNGEHQTPNPYSIY